LKVETRACTCPTINLFAIKGYRPLTHHTNSTNITIPKEKKCKVIQVMQIQ